MMTRYEIAKDAAKDVGCIKSEYKDDINIRIGLTLEVLVDIRDQNDIIIGFLNI